MGTYEEYVDIDGARLWTARSGKGPPLLLCHGGPGHWDYFDPVAAMIDDLVTVHRYDQRGCGRSSSGGPYSVARYVEDVEALRRHFGHRSWIVGGHSWGATLALAYAWSQPTAVGGLLYVSGVGLGSEWHTAYRAEAERRFTPEQRRRYLSLRAMDSRTAEEEIEYLALGHSRDYVDRATALDTAQRAYEVGLSVNYEANRTIGEEMNGWSEDDLVARCRGLGMPVLVLHGAADPRPSWGGDSMCESLPRVRRVVLEGAGHLPWHEKPEEVRAALRAFLQEEVLS